MIIEPILFESAGEMKELVVNKDVDLYSPDLKLYVFHYNDQEAVAVYRLENEEAYKLSVEADKANEYWGALLGPGGSIYDEPEEFFGQYFGELWVDTKYYPEYYKNFLEEKTMSKIDVIKAAAIEALGDENVEVNVEENGRVVIKTTATHIVPSFRDYDSLPDGEELRQFVIDSFNNTPNVDRDLLTSKEYILDNLVVKLGQDDLGEYVGEQYLDMSKTYYVDTAKAGVTDGRIHIKEDFLKSAGLTLEDLKAAEKKPEADIKDMATLFMGFGYDIGEEAVATMGQMNIGMAKGEPYGATLLLYPELIQKEMDRSGIKKAAIIPSSIYEVIIIDTEKMPASDEELKNMIGDVNANPGCVKKDEILSTHPYYIEDGKISYVS